MKFAVIQFPGSNCDQDCLRAINGLDGLRAEYVWHKATSLAGFDAVVLPGGFAYGDYLRYGDATGATSAESNPNGSIENIAGICNREGNVFGLMPHPDRACDSRLGSADGAGIFLSMAETILAGRAKAAA